MSKKKEESPGMHEELKGFNIHIDEFGQVKSTLSQEQLNTFLNEKVPDKKFSPKVRRQLEKLYRQKLTEEE